jgi:hypothetical protein
MSIERMLDGLFAYTTAAMFGGLVGFMLALQ